MRRSPPENPDRPLTPHDVAEGLRSSGVDRDVVLQRLRALREHVERAGGSVPDGWDSQDWSEYLEVLEAEDDARRRREYGEGGALIG